jgi:hypothetical protein
MRALGARLGRPRTILVLAACMMAVGIAAPAQASAETRTTRMTISASDSEPLVGERIFYSATLEPRPLFARMSFYDDGTAIAGCTDLFLSQKCWVEYGQPGEHTITATMTPSEEEESELVSNMKSAKPRNRSR